MILFFHFLCLLARYIVVNISNSLRQRKEVSEVSDEEEAVKNLSRSFLFNVKDIKPPVYQNQTLRFFPPIYVQRYETVALILQNFAEGGIIRKVVDFGCSELGLLPYLKNIESIREILEVDINEDLLKRIAFKAAPLTSDYIMSKGVRPLDVYLLAGNVADYDDHLAGCDTVICIELIEHLTEEIFYKMPFNIFHQIKPKVAIFTTPNADFNSLFPNFEGMRHEDHKFEWTRKEFYIWTQGILAQYQDYSVRFYGVGAGPEGTENLGCCSQVAVFSRSEDLEPFSSARDEPEGVHKYRLIEHFKYPFFVDTRTIEEKVIHEVQYRVSYLTTLPTYYNYEENETEIPISLLMEYVRDFCPSDDEFLDILRNSGYELRHDGNSWYLIVKESELNSSDTSFEEEEWLNKHLSHSFCADDSGNLEENWDLEEESQLEFPSFQTARSLEDSVVPEAIKFENEECAPEIIKDKTQSAPSSSNKLSNFLVVPDDSDGVKDYQQKPKKCRIPRKTVAKEAGHDAVTSSDKETSRVREPFRIISKSYSFDSCLENVSSQTDFCSVSGEHSLLRNVSSFSSGRSKRLMNESGSSLFSSSIDRAGDSGYPFSCSSPDASILELFTENDVSRSTSQSSEKDVVLPRPQPFGEDEVVENGDLANNNRDLEGNNVEGLMGQRLINERDPNDNVFFPDIGEFPPWLLNLGYLVQRPPLMPIDFAHDDDDEGVGRDTSSDSHGSLEQDEFDLYFET